MITGASSANVGAPKQVSPSLYIDNKKKEVSPNVIQDYRDTFDDQKPRSNSNN